MADYRIFGILILALVPLVLIAIIQIAQQSIQQKRLLDRRANFVAKKETIPQNTENVFFSEHIRMIEDKSKLRQHNEGQSPYSIWWPSFEIRDFSTNCKMTTSERGLR